MGESASDIEEEGGRFGGGGDLAIMCRGGLRVGEIMKVHQILGGRCVGWGTEHTRVGERGREC